MRLIIRMQASWSNAPSIIRGPCGMDGRSKAEPCQSPAEVSAMTSWHEQPNICFEVVLHRSIAMSNLDP